ncbi:MAG TPA: flagellar hook-length control protein FliK, partial [Pyrinomonadaceae bacterium]|nr:flagellar hook-length control protein FliK [Pyrinomonadaceae bacterium]
INTPPIFTQETNPVKMPPILPQQTTNPVETPPIFEQPETVKTEMDTQKFIIKVPPSVETPPIIVAPTNENPPIKNVTLNTNTKRIEQNTQETPPIVVLPQNSDTQKESTTTKEMYWNSMVKVQNPSTTQKSENNTSKNENNTAKVEFNTAKSENNTSKTEPLPTILLNTDRTNATREKDWNTSREPQTAEINMVQQVLNLSKMNGKAVKRENNSSVNTSVTDGKNEDYTPILIPNEIGSVEYSVKTANSTNSTDKPSKLENILFNLIVPKSAETAETGDQKSFGKISLDEFQIKDAPKNSKVANFENELTANAQNSDSGELVIEANSELFTKSVFPKRKDLASAYEAANFIRGEDSSGVKFEIPQEVKTPNSVEKSQISEQVEMKMTELAAKVEQTKETQILKMRLHPAELGTVEIHLEKNANGHLQAHLSTETETARTALHENIDQLRNTLEKAGWQVGAVEVSSSTTSTTHYNGNQQNTDSDQNNYYQSFSRNENAKNIAQTETNDKDDLSHIVSLRA